jgi:HAD superfamily hydrolase (TIGR01509 family)
MLQDSLNPTAPYAALIFDCDGTIVDTFPIHYQSFVAAMQPFGASLPATWLHTNRGLTAINMVQRFNHDFGFALDPDRINVDRQQHYLTLLHQVQPIPPVAEIAQTYHGQVPMAVASSGERAVVEATLVAARLRSLFDAIVTKEDVAQPKPAPDVFLIAAERLGVAPADCIVYEDSPEGLEAAERAGMRSIDIRTVWQPTWQPTWQPAPEPA